MPKAAQVTPSVVSDRYIQLTPAYTGGEKLARDATIERDRTTTPVEVDELYASVTELSEALGTERRQQGRRAVEPGGHRRDEPRRQRRGARRDVHRAVGGGTARSSDYRGDLFDTVENLQTFVSALAANDAQVRQFNTQLADLSGFLAGERQNLGVALNQLSFALGDVARSSTNNRELLASNAEGLTRSPRPLADHREALVDALTTLPLATEQPGQLATTRSPAPWHSRVNLPGPQDPFGAGCKLIDLGKLMPGDPKFDALGRQMRR